MINNYPKMYTEILDETIRNNLELHRVEVPPAEVEATLLQHPGVQDCGVVGLPDEYAGELPLAFVVRLRTSDVSERELVDFIASKLSKQKQLRGGVRFIKEIPKNAGGKILRTKLRELLIHKPMSKLLGSKNLINDK